MTTTNAQDPSAQAEEATPPADAVVVKVRSHNQETGWTILSVDRAGMPESWVGVMPEIREGVPVRATGEWETNKQYGRQFRVQSIIVKMPDAADPDALVRFLSKLVKGVGEGTCWKIVNALGAETIPALESGADGIAKIAAVKGVGEAKAKELSEEWMKHSVEGQLMVSLGRYGIRGHIAKKVIRRYGGRAMEICEKHPYLLAIEIDGIGFKTADVIAKAMGIPKNSVERMEAGLLHMLDEFKKAGHCYTPRTKLAAKTAELLELEEEQLHEGIHALSQRQLVEVEAGEKIDPEDRIFPTSLYDAECRVAARLARLLYSPAILRRGEDDPLGESSSDRMAPPIPELAEHAEQAIADFERWSGMTLAAIQKEAVRLVMREKVVIVTGPPGTGKTQTSKAMLFALESAGFDIALCSPTGKAAKRLSELTGRPASTIHRLLEYNPKEMMFMRRASCPLDETVILVDESSMLDASLASHLLDAIDDGARLILVGDVDQLPSVGAGAVLRDIIDSGVVPVVRLTEIFRQAQGSKIITNTHRVNQGLMPEKPTGDSDFFWVERQGAEKAVEAALLIITDRLQKRGISTRDCMVITPQNTGKAGVKALNETLQHVLNPTGKALTVGKVPHQTVYREGDRIIQKKNDYEREVFNGDTGWINTVSPPTTSFKAQIDTREIEYEKKHFENVSLGYAITCHRFQGSQAKAVIVIMLREHFNMLSRQWLYTSLSRGEKLVVLIADEQAVRIAVRETKRELRRTGLKLRLVSAVQLEATRSRARAELVRTHLAAQTTADAQYDAWLDDDDRRPENPPVG